MSRRKLQAADEPDLMQPTLRPEIRIEDRPGLTVCNTCGRMDGTIRVVSFRWYDQRLKGPVLSGGTGIALCGACRTVTREALHPELGR